MSGDSFPLNLPLSRFATDSCEATTLFQELRKPLLRYLAGLGLSAEEAQDVVQDAFLSLHKHLAGAGRRRTFAAGCFASPIIAPGTLSRATHSAWVNRSIPSSTRLRTRRRRNRRCWQKEKFRRLERAIRSLAEPERECLMLRAEGLRYREIGEVLGIPTSTVADMVERAIKKLAEKCNV